MNSKYLLECYDTVIRESKGEKSTADLINEIQSCSTVSHYIHRITFEIKRKRRTYTLHSRCHNLHPHAPLFENPIEEALPLLDSLLPAIADELNIPFPQMKYFYDNNSLQPELYVLEDIALENLPVRELQLIAAFQKVKRGNAIIRMKLKSNVDKLGSHRQIEEYIQCQQHNIASMGHRLLTLINPHGPEDLETLSGPTSRDCLKATFICLDKLARFLEKEYGNYLNVNMTVSYKTMMVAKLDLTDKISYIRETVKLFPIDEKLQNIIEEPMSKVAVINFKKKLSYREFNYCSEFVTKLHNLLERSSKLTDIMLAKWLFNFNFNGPAMFEYGIWFISQDLENSRTNDEKYNHLLRFRKDIKQQQALTLSRYDDALPPIRRQIQRWIDEEIKYIKKSKNTDVIGSQIHPKITANMSVPQLAYLFNILANTEMISTKSQGDLFKFIAQNFKTPATDQISAQSLSSKFYNVEASTKDAVRSKVIKLLNLLNE